MTKHWTILVTASLATLHAIFAPAPVTRADIFQWEYINPADPSLGKQQSTTLAPHGAGANAVPAADLSFRNLTMAYLIGADLSGATVHASYLSEAELSQANLTEANFSTDYTAYPDLPYSTDLTDANLTQANLTHANFRGYLGSDGEGDYYFSGANLTGANLQQANLTGADFWVATLTNANLGQANLTHASFSAADLTGADLTGAEVRGASFNRESLDGPFPDWVGGITLAQLYSTASYQAHDLTGISLALNFNNLAGANFQGQNLTNASFLWANLTGADFTGAQVGGANLGQSGVTATQLYSTASYLAFDLSGIGLTGINLTGADLSGQNLTNASFENANLTGANLTGAQVGGAKLGRSGITATQLYSTASYQAHDLRGIDFSSNNLAGWSLAGQNLSGADFSARYLYIGPINPAANMHGANLSQANLTNADFSGLSFLACDEFGDCGEVVVQGADLTGANLTAADARGANLYLATLDGANTSNLIQSNGHVAGLDLTEGASLVVRDYDSNPNANAPTGPLPIVVEEHLVIDATSTLRLEFDADPWDSTISFEPGVPVALGGTLELTFAPDVDINAQIGRTIDLFDWSGDTPTGAFTVSSPYTWNLSQLYTTGELTLTAFSTIAGDFDFDGDVDGRDFLAWQRNPSIGSLAGWQANYGAGAMISALGIPPAAEAASPVPEPGGLRMAGMALAVCAARGRARL